MVKITSLQLHFFSPSVKRCPPCKISNPIYWGDSPYLLTLFEKPCEGHIQVQKPTQALLQIRSPSNFRVESNIISMDSIIADIFTRRVINKWHEESKSRKEACRRPILNWPLLQKLASRTTKSTLLSKNKKLLLKSDQKLHYDTTVLRSACEWENLKL